MSYSPIAEYQLSNRLSKYKFHAMGNAYFNISIMNSVAVTSLESMESYCFSLILVVLLT